MVQSGKLVQVRNISVVCDPKLSNYGQMRDHCHDFTFEFVGGNAYGVIGECGSGGWALSYVLSGKVQPQNGEMMVNNALANQDLLRKAGCYLGEGITKKVFFREMTIRQQIMQGLKQNNKFTLQELTELFELATSRLDRKMEHISNERWNASAAIGLAHGKFIYCFPWLNTAWVNLLNVRINRCVEVLKGQGAIIILPTAKVQTLSDPQGNFKNILLPE